MINRIKRLHPLKLVFWTALFGVLTLSYWPVADKSEGYLHLAALTLMGLAVFGFCLMVSVNHWLDQRSEQKELRARRSIRGIEPRRVQARYK